MAKFRWKKEAEDRLIELYKSNIPIEEIAYRLSKEFNFQFTVNAITKKLQYMRMQSEKKRNIEGVSFKKYVFSTDKDIFFVSDLHIGGNQQQKRIEKLVNEIKERDCAVFFLGDILQSETLHSKGNPFGKEPSKDIQEFINTFSEVSGKIVAFISGNHENRVEKLTGINPIRDIIATMLGADYFPCALACSIKTPRSRFRVYAIHGNGYSRRVGGKLNRLEDLMQIAVADVYVTAHTHLPAYFNLRRVEIESDNLRISNVHFINCGSFQSYAGYSIEKGYVPTGTYFPIIKTSPFSISFIDI